MERDSLQAELTCAGAVVALTGGTILQMPALGRASDHTHIRVDARRCPGSVGGVQALQSSILVVARPREEICKTGNLST